MTPKILFYEKRGCYADEIWISAGRADIMTAAPDDLIRVILPNQDGFFLEATRKDLGNIISYPVTTPVFPSGVLRVKMDVFRVVQLTKSPDCIPLGLPINFVSVE